jgi:YidC/Oxa1 family membrane protein insertase
MDIKRNLLVLILAVVSYLLLLAWNEDYSVSAPVETTAAVIPELPQTTTVPTAGGAPTPPVDVPQVQQQAAPTTAATPNTSLITVSTPTQVVSIDPVGGDIVAISLPQFPTSLDTPNDPFPLMHNDGRGVYVAQSGLVGRNGPDAASSGRPRYSAAQTSYTLEEGSLTVDLVASLANNVRITKRFVFSADDYLIGVQHLIANNSATEQAMNLFAQVKRDGRDDPSSATGVGINTFLGAVLTTPDDPYYKLDLEDLADGDESFDVEGGWIGFSQHYFLGSWIAPATTLNRFSTRRNSNGEYLLGFIGPDTTIPAGQEVVIETALWAGPKDQYRLEAISPNLGLTIDYGMLWFVGYPIFWLLTQINDLVGNYGLAIILLTCVIRILFYPLSAKQFRSQQAMKRLQPKIAQLKDRYGDDKQRFMQAQMELWKKEGANPFSGCLPVLLQMPVFLGIYWVLNESVELRQAPFMLWYKDLSMMDPYFILPLLLGGAYYLQQAMTPMMTTDPMQEKVMKFMPVMFTVFFLWFPAGLVLYYLANALLSISQAWYFNFRASKETVPAAND